MKICSRCKIEKEYSEFTPRKDRPSAYRSICKQCWREYRRKYVSDNKWKVKISQNNYRIKNREEYCRKKREYERIRMLDPEKKKLKLENNRKYIKEHWRKNNKPPFKVWDNVKYLWIKWRVIGIIPWKWHKIQRYWDLHTLVIWKKYLIKYTPWIKI